AMTIVAAVDAGLEEVKAALAPVSAASGLHLSVWSVDDDAPPPPDSRPWRVPLPGADRPGLVAGPARALAEAGANITDLSCRLVGDLYVMTLEVESAVEPSLEGVAERLGVTLHVEPVDED